MSVTNPQSGTRIDEISAGIYRIHTPVGPAPGTFSFNQYLVVDEEPLLYHTGPRQMFPLVREAVSNVLSVGKLRYIGFSHFENDESGSLNEWLSVSPRAVPLCGRVNGLINAGAFDRQPRILADGEALSLGKSRITWFDTPHLPHAWECGHLFEEKSRTLFCGDLFTQGGPGALPLVTTDILGPSEAFRKQDDYYSHTRNAPEMLQRLSQLNPASLACMHGSAWQGDGANLLRALAAAFET